MTRPKSNGPDACNTQPAKTLTEHPGSLSTAEKIGNVEKQFAALQDKYALRGHTLIRTDPKYGTVTYRARRWGQCHHHATLDSARPILMQTGGPA